MTRYLGGVLSALFSALALPQAVAAPPSIVQIDAGVETDVFTMSADGRTVAGTTRLVSAGPAFAFRWTAEGGVELLPRSGGIVAGRVRRVSGDGTTFVGGEGQGGRALRWRPPGEFFQLPFLPPVPANPRSEAIGTAHNGSVIVGESGSSATGFRAFRWTVAGGPEPLGALPGADAAGSSAEAVSADGTIVVGSAIDAGLKRRAFRWTEPTGMVALPGLPDELGDSFALGVSPDGGTIFGSAATPRGTREAWRWTAVTGTVPLGDLAATNFRTFPRAATFDGSTIVGVTTGGAFIWNEAHGMRSLQEVLITDFGMDLTGWRLDAANAISYDGLTIAGTGRAPDGSVSGWVVAIPGPGCCGGFTIAGGLAAVRRRR